MRKWFLLVTVLALLAVGLSACNATTGTGTTNGSVVINNQQEGISVSGQGKVVVTPDLAELTLGVQSQESTVAAAQANATGAMNKVMTALTSNGIAGKYSVSCRNAIASASPATSRSSTGRIENSLMVMPSCLSATISRRIKVVRNAGKRCTA